MLSLKIENNVFRKHFFNFLKKDQNIDNKLAILKNLAIAFSVGNLAFTSQATKIC